MGGSVQKTNRNVRLPDDLHGAVKVAAAAKSITLEKAYEQALREWLEPAEHMRHSAHKTGTTSDVGQNSTGKALEDGLRIVAMQLESIAKQASGAVSGIQALLHDATETEKEKAAGVSTAKGSDTAKARAAIDHLRRAAGSGGKHGDTGKKLGGL